MSKMNCPIYAAKVTCNILKKTGRVTTVTRSVSFKNVFVKGFSMEDMIRRKTLQIERNIALQKGEFFGKITNIVLYKQHGYGIND